MAWFNNIYRCDYCNEEWEEEWSCTCDSECPSCGADYSPYESEDLSVSYARKPDGTYDILISYEGAEDYPDYRVVREGICCIANAEVIAEDILREREATS